MEEKISQTQPVVFESQPNRPWLKIITFSLLALLLAGGLVWAGYWYGKSSKLKAQNLITSPTPALMPTLISDPTADWKTYINTKIGFAFKYPNRWTEKGPVADYDTTIVYIHSDEKFGEEPEPLQYYLWVTEVKELPDREYTRESINKYTAYITDKEPSRSGALTDYITKDEKQYIMISLTPYDAKDPFPAQDHYIKTFDLILSTFKFLD